MGLGQVLALVVQILDMGPAEVDRMYQEIMEAKDIPHDEVLSRNHNQETPGFPRGLRCPQTRRGMRHKPTDLMGEMIDETNSAKAAQQVGQTTWTHMSQTIMIAMIALEILANMALQIPIGVHRVDAITDVNRQGGEVEALILEMGVEDESKQPNALESIQFYVASKSL
jgi:hypothetical protein